ncbi:hypothetical protein HOE31_01060 [bacterium]|jgi:transcriptional regulator with XRE-family HTH domain|nr:hypothetical protein [bacterium]MBT4335303.1 hypothetical protein [bacterium]MBT4495389.1 hypothetical protein [bacterium]MBT4763614.1 hypothetical protein [bacterium]MBT5400986.1 hypothetical protein [bacterium]
MTSFIQKKLPTNKTLPEILKDQRSRADLSLDEISFKTNISIKYIDALEKGKYDKLPGEIYNRQFIKKLANIYSLSEKSLLKIYQDEKESQLTFKELARETPKKENILNNISPKIIKRSLVILLILACFTYLGWEVFNIFSPPNLEIASPLPQTITTDPYVEIIGITEPEAILTINNQKVIIEPDGKFDQTVDLTFGLNNFVISAKKKHSKAIDITLSILRQGEATAFK